MLGVCRVVFSTLYLLLEFGHESPELAQRLDPPDSYFRVRLVCKLLQVGALMQTPCPC